MKKILKQIVQNVLGKHSHTYLYLYHRLYKKATFPSMEHCIDAFAAIQDEVYFMQIGANEGSTEDPLYYHIRCSNWKGILVEPLPDVFQKLKANFPQQQNLIFENVAISSKEEQKPFYYVRQQPGDNMPQWVSKLSSFDKNITVQVKEKLPGAKVVSRNVACTTASQLIQKHKLPRLDLLFIDTEGFDFEIIKTIDFSGLKPELLVFEHRHLSTDDYSRCMLLLQSKGYRLYRAEHDTVAMQLPELEKMYETLLSPPKQFPALKISA